jgi:hypothetical protein
MPYLTYALLALCVAALILGIALERRPETDPRFGRVRRHAWVLQIGAFVAAYFVLRPGAMPREPNEALRVAAASHELVFIDMYSNY